MKKEEVVELLKMFDELKPIIPLAVDKIGELGPMISPLIECLRRGIVESRIRSIDQYMSTGKFTREEAINMTLDDMSAIRKYMSEVKAKYTAPN